MQNSLSGCYHIDNTGTSTSRSFVRHNIDELCELPENIEFAAAINAAGGRPSYVWPSRFTHRRLPCVHGYNASADGER